MFSTSIPTTDDLTPEWFTDTLRASGALDAEGKVTAVSLAPLGKDESMMSRLQMASLSYEGATAGPDQVVVKMSSPAEKERFVAGMFKFYEREIRFYNEFAARTTIRRPACHLAEIHPENPDFVLVLEDIGGRRSVDQVDGLNFADTLTAIDAMVELQAPFWGADLESASETFFKFDSEGLHALIPDAFHNDWVPTKERYGDRMHPEVVALADRFREVCADVLRAMNGPQDTLIHGDFRADNFLFDDDGVIVFDYQLAAVSHGAVDLAYMLSQSVDSEVMATRADELIEHYITQLAAHGISVTADDIMPAYEAALVFYLQLANSLLVSESMPERSKQLGWVMFERASAEILRTGAHLRFA
jgi:hypothetical protein